MLFCLKIVTLKNSLVKHQFFFQVPQIWPAEYLELTKYFKIKLMDHFYIFTQVYFAANIWDVKNGLIRNVI